MKRYLLFLLMCVCASVGAWATNVVITESNGLTTIACTDNGVGEVTVSGTIPSTPTNVKITGPFTSSVSTSLTNGGFWTINNFNRLDLSEATGFTTTQLSTYSMFSPSDGNNKSGYLQVLILPKGAELPTTNQLSDNTAGSLDLWDALKYFVIPQTDGNCSVYLTSNSVSSINEEDIIVNSKADNSVSVSVFEGEGASETTKETVENSIKALGYNLSVQAAADEIVIDIATGGDLAAAIAEKGETEIHKVTIMGGTLSAEDITALSGLSAVTTLDISGATNAADVVVPAGVTDLIVPAGVTMPTTSYSNATNLTFIYSAASGIYPNTVNVLQSGGFADAVAAHGKLKTGNVKITGAVGSTDVDFNGLLTAEGGKTIDFSEAVLSDEVISAMKFAGNNSGTTPMNLIMPNSYNIESFPYNNGANANELGNLLKYSSSSTLQIVSIKPAALSLDATTLNGRTVVEYLYSGFQNKVNNALVAQINNAASTLEVVDFSAMGSNFDAQNLTNSTLTIDNDNLLQVILSNADNNSMNVNLTGCSSLESADFFNAKVKNIDVNGLTSLERLNLTDITLSQLTWTDAESPGSYYTRVGTVDIRNTTNLTTINVTDPESSEWSGETTSRFIPRDGGEGKLAAPIRSAVIFEDTDMYLHESETAGDNPDKFVYWYQGEMRSEANATISLNSESVGTLSSIISSYNLGSPHVKVKIVGPMNSDDLDALASINATTVDLSEAVIDGGESALSAKFSSSGALHVNTRFLVAPNGSTREGLINGTSLAGLSNILSVLSTETTSDGTNLTSWNRVPGTLQPAVVTALSSSTGNWVVDGVKRYMSNVSDFKVCKISGIINSYDLSKGGDTGQQLDADGHLAWEEDVVEGASQARTLNGGYYVYGPFSSCHNLTEIDLKNAYFEPVDDAPESEYKRYYCSDMTFSALGIITSSTYKIVIPQDPRVREIPADFMISTTHIRAICIPSNIRAIRTRAFYSLDYVWTTGDVANDPEGANTKLDNGAKVKKSGGSDYEFISATIYDTETGKYVENPNFTKEYYLGDYGTTNGGGTYTIGSNIKLIETQAFANTQPNVTDVYVLNTVAPECHVDAFNTVMYAGNNGYSPVAEGEKIIKRSNYYNGRWITMLHYPRQTTTPNLQRYTDPTREYSIATGERDGKGAILYLPNQSEFIRAYNQGTYGYIWNAWNPERAYGSVTNPITDANSGWDANKQAEANAAFNAYTSGVNHEYTSFYKVNWDGVSTTVAEAGSGTGGVVPYYQVNWNETSYTTATTGNLYPQSEKDLNSDADESGEMTSKDYRGWHQFVLNAYAANTILEEEPYRSYITDNEWWTICPEFDITYSEAMMLFGTPATWTTGPQKKPYVSKLKYVRRMYSEDGNHQIFLNFSENLMEHRESSKGENAQHGGLDINGVMEQSGTPNATDVIMSAGVPYLIKPNLTAGLEGGFNRQFRIMTSADYAKLTDEQKSSTSPRYIESNNLYYKIKHAQEMSGEAQMALIKSGTYTVPAFVHGRYNANEKGYPVEDVVMDGSSPKAFSISDSPYEKSEEWSYTFVGTFYKSFLPHFSYFLGWDSSLNGGNGGARFYYHDGKFGEIDNIMRWTNGTGVIVPIKKSELDAEGKFPYSVTPAADKTPAQWSLLTTFVTDDFGSKAGSRSSLAITFGSPDVVSGSGDATGINEVKPGQNELPAEADVYTVGGQQVGKSVNGLKKGIYIVNGKKYVVK